MHIPSVISTSVIDVLPFGEALSAALVPTPAYRVEDWLYVPNRYEEYRYILGTRGKRPVICVGINPSTAAPNDLDPTLKSAERIAHANGHDSFLMFNVYAQRATRPDDMERERNEWLHGENMKAFRYLLSIAGEKPVVWAAWGAIIEKRDIWPTVSVIWSPLQGSLMPCGNTRGRSPARDTPTIPSTSRATRRLSLLT